MSTEITRKRVEAVLTYYDGHPELMDALRAEENAIVQRVGNQSHTTTAIES